MSSPQVQVSQLQEGEEPQLRMKFKVLTVSLEETSYFLVSAMLITHMTRRSISLTLSIMQEQSRVIPHTLHVKRDQETKNKFTL